MYSECEKSWDKMKPYGKGVFSPYTVTFQPKTAGKGAYMIVIHLGLFREVSDPDQSDLQAQYGVG